jgi:hypothetical protein
MKLFLTFFCLLLAGLNGCIDTSKSIDTMPADFRFEYRKGPTHADRGGHPFYSIAPAANVKDIFIFRHGTLYKFYSKESGRLKDKEEDLIEMKIKGKALLPLYQAMVRNNFWELKDKYSDPDIMDGDYQLMKATANDRKKRVLQINYQHQAIKKIILVLKDLSTMTSR